MKISDMGAAFGYYKTEGSYNNAWNKIQVASYIPIIGVIAGIFHIILGIAAIKDSASDVAPLGKAAVITRGLIEIFSLGLLGWIFIAPDVVVNAHRNKEQESSADTSTPPPNNTGSPDPAVV